MIKHVCAEHQNQELKVGEYGDAIRFIVYDADVRCWMVTDSTGDYETQIFYCPFCGKQLQADAEEGRYEMGQVAT